MPASEARILANRKNAALSTGPRTEEGKERSRANTLKHGLSGGGVVMPEGDAAEVERRAVAFAGELNASDEVGMALARRAALNSVRMERAADQQSVAMTRRIRQVEADFVATEGVDAAEVARLRSEAVRIAMFDPSPEATLARRYESAAERAFFHCIKELRQRGRVVPVARKVESEQQVGPTMGSFSEPARSSQDEDDESTDLFKELNIPLAAWGSRPPRRHGADVPVTASRRG